MAVTAFHAGAGQYGLLTSTMAIGSVTGALLAARRARPRLSLLLVSAALFGFGCTLAACMPTYGLFGLTLAVIGVCTQTFTTSTNSLVQLSTEPAMRGRVIAILLAIALGGTPLGAPIVGWVADHFGPLPASLLRWSVFTTSGNTAICRCALPVDAFTRAWTVSNPRAKRRQMRKPPKRKKTCSNAAKPRGCVLGVLACLHRYKAA
jgi:MFS family permease